MRVEEAGRFQDHLTPFASAASYQSWRELQIRYFGRRPGRIPWRSEEVAASAEDFSSKGRAGAFGI